jgi:hypothetical protein
LRIVASAGWNRTAAAHSKMSARRHFPREAKQESGKEKKEVGLHW